MLKIADIIVGDLYHIPDYTTAMYDFVDPTEHHENLSINILPSDVPFMPLEVHSVNLKPWHGYKPSVVYRIKILTVTGIIGWLSMQDNDLSCIVPMTSCDKEL